MSARARTWSESTFRCRVTRPTPAGAEPPAPWDANTSWSTARWSPPPDHKRARCQLQRLRRHEADGPAGATASASRALPSPVTPTSGHPDASRTGSSIDGGVVWPVVPAGVYRVTARHRSTRFAPSAPPASRGGSSIQPPQGSTSSAPARGRLRRRSVARLVDFDLSVLQGPPEGAGQAREYVAVAACRARQEGPSRPSHQGLCAGKRTLAFPIGQGLAGKQIAVKLTREDGQGNVKPRPET